MVILVSLAAVSMVVVALQVSCYFSYEAAKNGEREETRVAGAKVGIC